jgi:nucleotide-binding universal stress UspA family protein
MTVLLIPVDPDHPAHTRVAVERAAALCAAAPQAVHLLSVQPPVSAHVGQFFAPGELHAFHEEAGQEELAEAGAQLSAAGVPFTEPAGLAGRLFGTVAEQVRHALGAGEPVRVLGA